MHEKMRALQERHARELDSLQKELEVLEGLPSYLPGIDRVHVFRHPLFGTEGRLTWKEPTDKDALAIAHRLSPYEPLVRCKQAAIVAFATVPPLPVDDRDIGPVLVSIDFDASVTVKWIVRREAKGLWWVHLDFPKDWGKEAIGHRLLERAPNRDDRIPYEHRPVTRCSWQPGRIPLRHVTRYGGGLAEIPATFVLQFEKDYDPLRLLTEVLRSAPSV